MKITKERLKQIIKEEIESVQKQNINESIRSFLKTGAIHSTIPAGSLRKVLSRNPELTQKARNAADPRGQMIAFQQIGKLLAQDEDIVAAIGSDPIEDHLDVRGLLRYAEQNMPHLWL
tara:strand:+ start:122 stop:475 length:354 start_codon:yes stop_codon:yes gene_type:complete